MPDQQNEIVEPSAWPEMLNAILQTAVGAILTIDDRGIIQNANPACVRMFGYPIGELVGHNVSKLMPEPHQAQHDNYVRRHIETGEQRIIGIGRELEGRRKDGTTFWMHLSVSAFKVGGNSYFAGTVINLDERKGREALMAAVFDHIPDGLVITDLDRRIIQCNRAFCSIFGYELGELQDQSTRKLYADPAGFDRSATFRLHKSDQPTDTHIPFEMEFRRKNGDLFPSVIVEAPVCDPNGRALAIIGIVRDVTRERTQAAALSKSQRFEAYGQLTGGMAHDFNNLLTIIMGNQELLEIRLKDERDRILLKRAQDAADMGARLTARLLTFARRRKLEPVLVNLNELLLSMAELLRRTLGEPIQMSSILASSLWPTRADPSEIENAILNLAINARDAMPNGGKLVIETQNISTERLASELAAGVTPGDYLRISVADTGVGMSKATLARAFEPFFTTKEPGHGTGLGLSTIYGFAQQSGGGVSIYSEIGRGTVVNIYLPRADVAAVTESSMHTATTTPPIKRGRILVVEDNPDVREVTLARLNDMGFTTIPADSGPAAVAILQSDTAVDLVFSDVVMAGGMSGYDVVRWVRDHRPSLKVLLTSGFVTRIAQHEGADFESMKVLRKPYSRADLATALRTALDSH